MRNLIRANELIQSPIVLLVDPDGNMIGEVSRNEALNKAKQYELDLVEIDPTRNGHKYPVCKIMDYGKARYQISKKNKHQKHHEHVIKEIKSSARISDHDLLIKHKKVRELLSKKYHVKYVIQLNGREKQDLLLLLNQRISEFIDVAEAGQVNIQGKSVSVLLRTSGAIS